MSPQSNQCFSCRHYRVFSTCDAFPQGIPEPIWQGLHNHRYPFEGDQGILFQSLRDEEGTTDDE